jgi:L-threonylcarbamoyladenylate synthase
MQNDIKKALDVLKSGGIILYPTDTIWGIGCDATNSDAVEKIYQLKQRADTKSMLVLVENPNWLYEYLVEIPPMAHDLIDLSTKPITIIYPKAKKLAPNLVAADGSVGIRVVKHAFCQNLIKVLGKPIVSTSANLSGQPHPKSFAEIDRSIIDGVDFIVPKQYEESTHPKPSSIVQLGLGGEVKVIRE